MEEEQCLMIKKQKISHTLLPHQRYFLQLLHKRTWSLDLEEIDEVFRFAAENGFYDTVGLLLKGMSLYDRSDFLWEAGCSEEGELEITQVLLQHGALVDRCHHISGRTPLMDACIRKRHALAKLLLDWGANFDALHSDGTPWTYVVKNNELGLVDCMLAKGANPNAPCESAGDAPSAANALWLACCEGSGAVAKRLIERGADWRVMVNGMSLLHVACETECFDVAKFLIAQNYKLEFVESPYFRVPLLSACVSTSPAAIEVVEEMILRGVPINSVSDKLQNNKSPVLLRSFATPLHLALHHNNVKMVWLLVSLGGHSVVSFPFVRGDSSLSAWELCNGNHCLTEALFNRWGPQNHRLFPKPVRDAIFSLLLVNKRKNLYIPQKILHHIFSYIAYGWLPLTHPAIQVLDIEKTQTINCQGSIRGIPSAIQENTSHFTIVT